MADINVVVVLGRLARPVQLRQLPSGDTLAEYQVTTRTANARAEIVSVVWERPPGSATDFGIDAEVVVVGRVRRRFLRAGNRTESRTEVVAEAVVPALPSRQAKALIATALARITDSA